MPQEPKFKVGRGITGGSKQVTFYYIDKVTHADILKMVAEEFPGVPADKINYLPGAGNMTVTTGTTFEAPPI